MSPNGSTRKDNSQGTSQYQFKKQRPQHFIISPSMPDMEFTIGWLTSQQLKDLPTIQPGACSER
jgi:hypothetical protein